MPRPSRTTVTAMVAIVAVVAALSPYPGMYLAMVAGPTAMVAGFPLWRSTAAPARRLCGIVSGYAGALATVVAAARFVLTWVAVSKLIDRF